MIAHPLKYQLDALHSVFATAKSDAILDRFSDLLNAIETHREAMPEEAWRDHVDKVRSHPVFASLSRCPMTLHSVQKPRGYPGDAALLDWIYFPEQRATAIEDDIARELYHHNARRTAPSAVRARATRLAKLIDEVPDQGSVLALACGHFREAEFCDSIMTGRIARVDVADQDVRSLEVVRQRSLPNVRAFQANVIRFPAATAESPKYDLVYAAGLFDYFSQRMAQRVARRLWTYVAPGGRLCIPNFNVGIPDAGYLECFMDWWLTYRDREQMQGIADALPDQSVETIRCDLLDEENIWYLQAQRIPSLVTDRKLRIDPATAPSRPRVPQQPVIRKDNLDSAT